MNEEQTSERSDNVCPYLMVACVQVPVRKFPERLCTAWRYFKKCSFFPCVCTCAFMYLCIGVSVHLALSFERHQRATDLDPGGICGGPLFAPPSTSARVQSRCEFVDLGGDQCSNYQGEVPAGTGTTG